MKCALLFRGRQSEAAERPKSIPTQSVGTRIESKDNIRFIVVVLHPRDAKDIAVPEPKKK